MSQEAQMVEVGQGLRRGEEQARGVELVQRRRLLLLRRRLRDGEEALANEERGGLVVEKIGRGAKMTVGNGQKGEKNCLGCCLERVEAKENGPISVYENMEL